MLLAWQVKIPRQLKIDENQGHFFAEYNYDFLILRNVLSFVRSLVS